MKKRTIFLIAGLLILFAGVLLISPPGRAVAQAPQPTPSDNDVNRVAKQMFCPVCENTPLDVCPTQACHDWRELIRQKMAQGWSDQQIKDYFATQYGDRVLAEPPRRGLNWVVYLLPVAAILIGAGIVWSVISSMRRRRTAAQSVEPAGQGAQNPPPAPTADDAYLRRLEEELKKKD